MADYWESWRNWKPGPGPVAWRQPYHGHPDPEFIGLCTRAESRGLRVTLDVGSQALGREPYEYRQLGPLIVGIPERPQMIIIPFGLARASRTLREAAVEARRMLAALAGGATDA